MTSPVPLSWEQGPPGLHARLPDDLRHAELIRLHADWHAWCRGRAMPARGDFDPLDLTYILGHLLLIDVIGGPPFRFRYRLIGTMLTQRTQRDRTGQFVDGIEDPVYRDRVHAWHRGVVDARAPAGRVVRREIDGRWAHYEMLTLPLSSDGMYVDMTLSAFRFFEP